MVCQNLLFDGKKVTFNLEKPFKTIYEFASRSLWQELQNDYRTLIGVTIDKSDVNLPSKISNEEQKNV